MPLLQRIKFLVIFVLRLETLFYKATKRRISYWAAVLMFETLRKLKDKWIIILVLLCSFKVLEWIL